MVSRRSDCVGLGMAHPLLYITTAICVRSVSAAFTLAENQEAEWQLGRTKIISR